MRSSAPIQRLKAAKLRRLAGTMQPSPERTIKLERAAALELQAKAQDSDPSLRPIEAGRQKVLTDKFAMQELSERLRRTARFRYPIDGLSEMAKTVDAALEQVLGPEDSHGRRASWVRRLRSFGLIP